MGRRIELLDPAQHDRAGFGCGVIELNRLLQQVARQQAERGVSKTFVLVEDAAKAPRPVLGFFSLSACEAEGAGIPPAFAKRLPNKVPVARLGRLAVAIDHQGQKLGRVLLFAALEKIAKTSDLMGIAFVFVDAKDEHVAQFYGRYGFEPMPDSPLTLFMSIGTLRQGLALLDAK